VGGYLIYAKWPEVEVFVDDRAELFGGEFFELVIESRLGGPGWTDVAAEWEIGQVLLARGDGLVENLRRSGWTITYEDDGFVVMNP
jgi:hypothetical protein